MAEPLPPHFELGRGYSLGDVVSEVRGNRIYVKATMYNEGCQRMPVTISNYGTGEWEVWETIVLAARQKMYVTSNR